MISHFAKDPLKMGLFAKKMQSANRVKAYRDTNEAEGGEKKKPPKVRIIGLPIIHCVPTVHAVLIQKYMAHTVFTLFTYGEEG